MDKVDRLIEQGVTFRDLVESVLAEGPFWKGIKKGWKVGKKRRASARKAYANQEYRRISRVNKAIRKNPQQAAAAAAMASFGRQMSYHSSSPEWRAFGSALRSTGRSIHPAGTDYSEWD